MKNSPPRRRRKPSGVEDHGVARFRSPTEFTGDLMRELLIHDELRRTWILKFSTQRELRERFFVTFVKSPSQWRRIMVLLDYRNAPAKSLEADLLKIRSQRDRWTKVYESIRESLAVMEFKNSVTGLKVRTTDGRLRVSLPEGLDKIIDYLSPGIFHGIPYHPVTENSVKVDHHIVSSVYKVRVDGRVLARKDVPGPEYVEEFLKQIRTLGQLRHSRFVVDFYGVVLTQDREWVKGFLMPFCERGPLTEVINDSAGKLSWARREKWAWQVVTGLSHIHDIGAVHGNLTLSRIGLEEDDNIRILGPGSWRMRLRWASPEVAPLIRSRQNIALHLSPTSDIYQLGMVLSALASQVDKPEASAKQYLVTAEMDAPTWYKLIVESCLSPDPRGRPSATSLLAMWGGPKVSHGVFDDRALLAKYEADSSKPVSVVDDDGSFEAARNAPIATPILAHPTYAAVAKDPTTSFADLLDESMDLTNIMQKALEQKKLSSNALRNGVRRLLNLLSRDLSSELPALEHRDVCNFFMSSSRQIVQEIANRAEVKVHHTSVEKEPPEDSEMGSPRLPRIEETVIEVFDNESDAEEEAPVSAAPRPEVSSLREVVASSDAFREFMSSLTTLVSPSFESRLGRVSQVATEKAAEIDRDGSLRETVAELLYSRPTSIMLSDSMSWMDVGKYWIESYTRQELEWWPLRPVQLTIGAAKARLHWQWECRFRPLRHGLTVGAGKARLQWRCLCGEVRTAVLAERYARYIVKLRQETIEAPSDSAIAESLHPASTPAPTPAPETAPTTATTPGTAQSGIQKYVGAPQPTAATGKYKPVPRPHPPSASQATETPSPQSRYVLFVVPGSALRLCEIESTGLCNESLFRRIRDEYRQAKGRFKSWFGLMVYSHCDFHKFEAWHRGRYCEREIGIPAKDDQQYFYVPKPMDREPPISKHEFYDRFYRRVELEDCILQRSDRCAERDAVERIPQKKDPFDSTGGGRPQFYGIIARERKSGLRMLIYVFASSIPGVIFLFLWLFQWDHDSLQDAFGLLMASFTLLGLLYAAQLF